jgi:hypothetical protein
MRIRSGRFAGLFGCILSSLHALSFSELPSLVLSWRRISGHTERSSAGVADERLELIRMRANRADRCHDVGLGRRLARTLYIGVHQLPEPDARRRVTTQLAERGPRLVVNGDASNTSSDVSWPRRPALRSRLHRRYGCKPCRRLRPGRMHQGQRVRAAELTLRSALSTHDQTVVQLYTHSSATVCPL